MFVHPGPDPWGAESSEPGLPAWWPAMTGYVTGMHTAWHAWTAAGRDEQAVTPQLDVTAEFEHELVAVAARRRRVHAEHDLDAVAAEDVAERRAQRCGLPREYALGNVAGASLFADGYEGSAIAVVDTDREVLLGVTFIGPAVAELLQAATIAVVGEVPISRLWHAVPAYPTMSEVWLRLLETYGRP